MKKALTFVAAVLLALAGGIGVAGAQSTDDATPSAGVGAGDETPVGGIASGAGGTASDGADAAPLVIALGGAGALAGATFVFRRRTAG